MRFPKTTPLVVAAIKAAVDVKVATNIPSPRPDKLVRVERAGGGGRRDKVLDNAAYVISCWAPDDLLAEDLAQDVREALDAWVAAGNGVYNYRDTGPVSFPDPATRNPRFVFRCSFDVRGQPA